MVRLFSFLAMLLIASILNLSIQSAAAQEVTTDLTFHKDILPIFQKHCMECHHTGGSAPQSLETYQKSRPWLRSSKKTMQDGLMPPWHAGTEVGKWKNAPTLTKEEIDKIVEWVDATAPEGDSAGAPPAMEFPEWKLGEPAKIFQMSEMFPIPAEGGDIYRAFIISEPFEADTWVSAIEIKPGVPDVAIDVLLMAIPAQVAKQADDADQGPGFMAFDTGWGDGAEEVLQAWTHGMSLVEKFPEGTGELIRKGTVLVTQIHYIPVGEEVEDQTKVGIHIAPTAPAKEVQTLIIENRKIDIPEESYDFKISAEKTLSKSIVVHSIYPRMHYIAREMTIGATKPGGSAEKILELKEYDYTLNSILTPVEPIVFPQGTRIDVVGFFENAPDNPNIPSMTIKKVGYGAAPMGEVLSVIVTYTEQ